LILTSCSVLQLAAPSKGGDEGEFETIDLSGEEPGSGQAADSGENTTGDILKNFVCPESPETFELWSAYDIKFNTGAVGTWDINGSGAQLISVAEGITDNAAYGLNPGEVRIPGYVKGEFSRDDKICKFGQDLEIISGVSGNCQDGVIYLNVVTNFSEVNTEMTCCEGDDCHTGPFFWLLPVTQFDIKLSEANGFTETKNFAGGEGTLKWELQGVLLPVPID